MALALLCAGKSSAQVNFQLTLMPDKKTYMVSMIPEKTFSFPQNITGTAQVTIRIPTKTRFTAGDVKNLQSGVEWHNNVTLEGLTADPTHDYISFALKTMGTKNIPYEAGKETPLFSFRNIRNDCVGTMELVVDNDPSVLKVFQEGYNVKNHISILGLRGEGAKGVLNAKADCNAIATGVNESQYAFKIHAAYPVPTFDALTIEYQNTLSDAKNLQLVVTDILGKEITRQGIPLSMNREKVQINVSDWSNGLYLFRITDGKGRASATQKFVVQTP
ncbi:MAG: T9SS type A sorting domain-containing protein [Saprospiraceae bacterium]|nr:T9SS type A sorting domain-containing protein [Saprospiraceae bacterium]